MKRLIETVRPAFHFPDETWITHESGEGTPDRKLDVQLRSVAFTESCSRDVEPRSEPVLAKLRPAEPIHPASRVKGIVPSKTFAEFEGTPQLDVHLPRRGGGDASAYPVIPPLPLALLIAHPPIGEVDRQADNVFLELGMPFERVLEGLGELRDLRAPEFEEVLGLPPAFGAVDLDPVAFDAGVGARALAMECAAGRVESSKLTAEFLESAVLAAIVRTNGPEI
ncbi:MAG TPA: hypothetical protein VF702_03610 [Allosphingosinicella sp.]